jgi:hypothetical protein
MAATILPQNCPICKEDILAGQKRRIVCHDMTDWPSSPPVSVYAHAACISSRGFEGVSVLTSVADPGRIIQPQLSLALA